MLTKDKERLAKDDAAILSLIGGESFDFILECTPEEVGVFARVAQRLHDTLVEIQKDLDELQG